MPTVATQTDLSLTSQTGYLGWLKENRDLADGIPSVEEKTPKKHKKNTFFKIDYR